jgi:HAD superfamily hydrolase (TIGR01509 family)
MIKTVIFDMDGVIVNTEPIHNQAYKEQFKQLGIEVSPEMYATFMGKSTQNVFQKLKEDFQLNQTITELIDVKRALFTKAFYLDNELTLLDGVEDLIKNLVTNGMQLILASSSSKETINSVFTRFNLHSYFDFIVSGEDFVKSKPDPSIFIHAAKLSGGSKDECIVIEDSTNGILASKLAGIYCIGYDSPNSKLQDYSNANMVITDFKTLNYEEIRALKN